jgi:hypothetical protein
LIAIASKGQSSRPIPSDAGDKIVRLYPNPATSYITFDLSKGYDKSYSIQVFSFLGKKMYESQATAQKLTVDLSEYNRGLYIYHLVETTTGKIVESGKFQVSR